MGRLIDADALIEKIKADILERHSIIEGKFNNGVRDYTDSVVMQQLIFTLNVLRDAPTAYDVDKVVEELGVSCCENRFCVDCFDCYFEQAIHKSIDVIKRGGVNDI